LTDSVIVQCNHYYTQYYEVSVVTREFWLAGMFSTTSNVQHNCSYHGLLADFNPQNFINKKMISEKCGFSVFLLRLQQNSYFHEYSASYKIVGTGKMGSEAKIACSKQSVVWRSCAVCDSGHQRVPKAIFPS